MLLLKAAKNYADLATKKGMVLTGSIAAAIVGSSFLIWYIPQSSPGGPFAARSDEEVFGNIYSRSNDLDTTIKLRFDEWKNNDLSSMNMTVQLIAAKSQIEKMRQDLLGHQPAQEWKEPYNIYIQALDSYMAYLDALSAKVNSGDRTDPDPTLNQKWQDLVKKSADAINI